VYDTGTEMIGNTRHLGGVADALKKSKKGNKYIKGNWIVWVGSKIG
jgi:hypothetical protein